VILLNTNSIVAYDLRRNERDLYLRKGEAHFQVAHDRARPFLVHAGDAIVRAVGTQFDVHVLAGNHVDVLVDEGRVEVVPAIASATTPTPGASAPPSPPARVLSAGQQLSSGDAGFTVVSVTPVRTDHQLAWREGAVMFDGEPLSEAVAEIGRYTDARLVITDRRVAAMRFGGRFRTDDLNGFLAALQAALPVSVRTDATGAIYIDARR
ncbi:MAG: FecR domain-containing protein, partial [Proteobacteria bacterium]|nr:FecR domain-containing protein [Pseudomonadota bacterium]